jgi:hypothetical protein
MTAAQQLRQEGMHAKTLDIAKEMLSELHLDMRAVTQQLGRRYEQKGRQQEKLIIAKRMLSRGLAVDLIQELVGISEKECRHLERTCTKDTEM